MIGRIMILGVPLATHGLRRRPTGRIDREAPVGVPSRCGLCTQSRSAGEISCTQSTIVQEDPGEPRRAQEGPGGTRRDHLNANPVSHTRTRACEARRTGPPAAVSFASRTQNLHSSSCLMPYHWAIRHGRLSALWRCAPSVGHSLKILTSLVVAGVGMLRQSERYGPQDRLPASMRRPSFAVLTLASYLWCRTFPRCGSELAILCWDSCRCAVLTVVALLNVSFLMDWH